MLRLSSFCNGIVAASTALSYKNTYTDTSVTSNFTFSNVDIGTADTNRIVVGVVVRGKASAGLRDVTTVTIGGVAATKHVNSGTTNSSIGIWSAAVPTGSTATIVTTQGSSATFQGMAIGVWAGIPNDATSHNPNDHTSGTNDTILIGLNAIGDVVIAGSATEGSGTYGASTWSGVDSLNVRATGTVVSTTSFTYLFVDMPVIDPSFGASGTFTPNSFNTAFDRHAIANWN